MSYNQPPPGYGPYGQQPQWGPVPPPPPGRRKGHPVRTTLIVIGSLFAALLVIGVAASGGNTPGTAASTPPVTQPAASVPASPAAASSQAPAAQTVTYVVTGSPADVTYGPTGSNSTGTVPMRKTVPLGHPQYYAVDAQLQGDGTVTCEILVNGKVISKATASGSYNIASCEISQDMFSGDWTDANSG